MRLRNRRGIHYAHHEGQRVTDQHADQNRDNCQEAAEQHGAEHGHAERHQGNNNGFGIRRLAIRRQQACHVGRYARQLKTDDGNDCAHRRRREHHVQPAGTRFLHNERDQAEQYAAHNKAAQRHFIT